MCIKRYDKNLYKAVIQGTNLLNKKWEKMSFKGLTEIINV